MNRSKWQVNEHEKPRVKICGLTNLEDALAAVEAGADLLGFIFYEKSPRYVDATDRCRIIARISKHVSRFTSPRLHSRTVGVFVNSSLEQVVQMLNYCDLDLAQLHGEEPRSCWPRCRGRAFKALRPRAVAEAAG